MRAALSQRSVSPWPLRGVIVSLLLTFGLSSAALAQVATTTALSISTPSVAVGVPTLLTATVTDASSHTVLLGTVTFYDGSRALGSAQIVSGTGGAYAQGTAHMKTASFALGANSITAVFSGTTTDSPSTSTAKTVTVSGQYQTSTVLSAAGSDGIFTLTGALQALGVPLPTGSVDFMDTTVSSTLGIVPLSGASWRPNFLLASNMTSGNGPVLGDFNDDGFLDLAQAYFTIDTVGVLLGNGDGTFSGGSSYGAGYYSGPRNVVAGDFNNDGKLDLAVVGGALGVLLGNGDGTFQAQQIFAAGDCPDNLAIGDFNRDGKLDVVVTNQCDNTVSVFLGKGDGTFLPQQVADLSPDANPRVVQVGDLNGDGIPDLFVTSDNADAVLLGNGDGTFQPQKVYALGTGPNIALGDVNGDGKLDAVLSNGSSNTITVALGKGDGSFEPPESYAVSPNPGQVVIADFNGDGKLDLAVTSQQQANLGVLLGNGNGTFQSEITYSGSSSGSLLGGDFNGDGRTDLAITGSVLLNWQTANLQLTNVALPGSGTTQVIANYAGDGVFLASTSNALDLVTGTLSKTEVILQCSGNSIITGQPVTLTATVTNESNSQVILGTVTFYDGSRALGTAQVISQSGGSFSQGTATLKTNSFSPGANNITAVYAGTTSTLASTSAPTTVTVTGKYATSTALTSSGSPAAYTLTAALEAVGGGTPTGSIGFLDTTTNSTLGTVPLSGVPSLNGFVISTPAVGQYPAGVAAGDFNGDGLLDLVTANNSFDGSISVLLGNGDGTFQSHVDYPADVDGGNNVIYTGDFNNDGKLDLAVAAQSSGVNIFLGNGDGTFQAGQGLGVGGFVADLRIADFNRDGNLDLVVTTPDINQLFVFLGNGDGTFQSPQPYYNVAGATNLAVGDLNGDGIPDVVVNGNGVESVLLGNGDGTLAAPVVYSLGAGPYLTLADVNGDGKLDIVVCNNTLNTVTVSLGNGNGTFQPAQTYTVAGSPGQPVVADYNGDGKPDIAVPSQIDQNIQVLPGIGDGTFGPAVVYATANAHNPQFMIQADLNGDGRPDLVATSVNAVTAIAGGLNTVQLTDIVLPGTGTAQIVAEYSGDANFVASTSNTLNLLVKVTPHIASVSATYGAHYANLELTGTNFQASQSASTVTFNGVAAPVVSWSSTVLQVTAPGAATTGNIVVTVNGQASNGVLFTIEPSPTVTGMFPATGPVGTLVTISGNNLLDAEGHGVVYLGARSLPILNPTSTSLQVEVPVFATSGAFDVHINGVGVSTPIFTVMSTSTMTNPDWVWVGGSSTPLTCNRFCSQAGVWGDIGVASKSNIPSGRNSSTTWTDSAGNFWLFGGSGQDSAGNSGNLNDLWEFSPSTREWTWVNGSNLANQGGGNAGLGVPDPGNSPSARANASSWTDKGGNFWLFGGPQTNDMWEFSPSTREWTWMGGGRSNGVYGTLNTPAVGNIPGSRGAASSWVDSDGDFWLYGGQGVDKNGYGGDLDDLWKFNPIILEWAWGGGNEVLPCYINVNCTPDMIYFGDYPSYGTLGVPSAGNNPGGRDSGNVWVDRNGNFWLFGGGAPPSQYGPGAYGDLWQFNPTSLEWTWMGGPQLGNYGNQPGVYGTLGDPSLVDIPGSRSSANTWTDGEGNLWLFGGSGTDSVANAGDLSDLWEFNPSETPVWTWVAGSEFVNQVGVYGALSVAAAANTPGARSGASNWIDGNGNLCFLAETDMIPPAMLAISTTSGSTAPALPLRRRKSRA